MTYKLLQVVLLCLSSSIIHDGFKYSEAHNIAAMYVFGDSLVDVGNNNYLLFSFNKANFPHNGIDYPFSKATGRFGNGKNTADFLAEKLRLPYPEPYLSLAFKQKMNIMQVQFLYKNGVNFASAGAGIFNATHEHNQLIRQSVSLTKQVDYYSEVHTSLMQQLGASAAQKHLHDSLFPIVIGNSDILAYSASSNIRSEIKPKTHINLMAQKFKEQLQRLYEKDARKFAITGVGALGCTPTERVKNLNQECSKELNEWSLTYNRALRSILNELKTQYNDVHFSYFDSYGLTQNLIENPASYGFVEVKAACCGLGRLKAEIPCLPITKYCTNRNQHMFWDGSHLTEAAHRVIVDYMYNGTFIHTFPINVKMLAHI